MRSNKVASLLAVMMTPVVLFMIVYPWPRSVQAGNWQEKVDPWVLTTAARQAEAEFLVYLTAQADLSAVATMANKEVKGAYIYAQSVAIARETQAAVIAQLIELGVEYQPFWIANMIWVQGDQTAVATLAQRSDVAHLYANPAVSLPAQPVKPDGGEAAEWNIALVRATDVWSSGITGDGIVIGGQDTGYDWDHNGLRNQYRGWNGTTANHDYNWHDTVTSGGGVCGPNTVEPCDDGSHGTHTMGTMVGNDLPPASPGWPAAAANAVGMAPGAKWIGCRNMNRSVGTPASYSECYQWFIAPYPLGGDPMIDGDPLQAPHVINNSWYCPPSEGCTDPNVLLSIVQTVRAAGIVTVHSAGNSGPTCSSVSGVATLYDESFSVGATNSYDNITGFSSRGPVLIDGSGRLKPDVSAPGSSIRSTTPNDGYGINGGTSMAAPHVAGLVALVLEANPALAGDVDTIEQIIQDAAVPLTTTEGCGGDLPTAVPNNTYGWGRIDAFTAVQKAGEITILQLHKETAAVASAGSSLTYTLTVTNAHPLTATSNVVLSDTIPAHTLFLTATQPFTISGDTVRWERPSLHAQTAWSVSLTVEIAPTATITVANAHYAAGSDEAAVVSGPAVITHISGALRSYIPVVVFSPPAAAPP